MNGHHPLPEKLNFRGDFFGIQERARLGIRIGIYRLGDELFRR